MNEKINGYNRPETYYAKLETLDQEPVSKEYFTQDVGIKDTDSLATMGGKLQEHCEEKWPDYDFNGVDWNDFASGVPEEMGISDQQMEDNMHREIKKHSAELQKIQGNNKSEYTPPGSSGASYSGPGMN